MSHRRTGRGIPAVTQAIGSAAAAAADNARWGASRASTAARRRRRGAAVVRRACMAGRTAATAPSRRARTAAREGRATGACRGERGALARLDIAGRVVVRRVRIVVDRQRAGRHVGPPGGGGACCRSGRAPGAAWRRTGAPACSSPAGGPPWRRAGGCLTWRDTTRVRGMGGDGSGSAVAAVLTVTAAGDGDGVRARGWYGHLGTCGATGAAGVEPRQHRQARGPPGAARGRPRSSLLPAAAPAARASGASSRRRRCARRRSRSRREARHGGHQRQPQPVDAAGLSIAATRAGQTEQSERCCVSHAASRSRAPSWRSASSGRARSQSGEAEVIEPSALRRRPSRRPMRARDSS